MFYEFENKWWHWLLLIILIIILMVAQFMVPKGPPKVRAKTDIELWQEYAKSSDCKIIERHDGYSDDSTGFGMTDRGSGVMIGSNYHSAQDLWQCADGVKHFKAARFAEQAATSSKDGQ